MALHDAEENSYGTAIYEKVESYVKLKIWDNCKLTFTEYMSLPREYAELIIKLSATQTQNAARQTEEQLNALQGQKQK
mgnify:CR=1 FL=1